VRKACCFVSHADKGNLDLNILERKVEGIGWLDLNSTKNSWSQAASLEKPCEILPNQSRPSLKLDLLLDVLAARHVGTRELADDAFEGRLEDPRAPTKHPMASCRFRCQR
jgi:hypothetical protein